MAGLHKKEVQMSSKAKICTKLLHLMGLINAMYICLKTTLHSLAEMEGMPELKCKMLIDRWIDLQTDIEIYTLKM